MASIQIPNLPAVTGLTGAELFEGVQAGTSVKISLDQIIAAVYGNDPIDFPIPVYLGGTGLSSFTVGDIMYASATQTLSTLADVATGNAIISGGVGAAPSYGKIGLTTHVDGVLPVVNGGTGVTTSTGTGSVVLSDSPALTGQVSFADGTAAAPSITNTGDLNAGLFFPAADNVAVSTAGTQRFIVDASGNVGIGVTPTASTGRTLQFPTNVVIGTQGIQSTLSTNAYYDAAWKYHVTGEAAYYNQTTGTHQWSTAPSGTAGTTATFTERFRIANLGQIGIGGANYGTTGQTIVSAGSGAAPAWGVLPAAGGGTGATSAPAAAAVLMGYTSTATAGATTTLTNTSSQYQLFTGTLTQTITLPVTSTLTTGWTFHIVNNSTGNLTVNSSGGNLVCTVISGMTAMVTCIGTTLTTAADWEFGFTDFGSVTGTGSAVLSASPALTGNVTVTTNSASAALTINQTGAGNAFVVEDSTSPDASPFVIDATGNVGIGTTSPGALLDVNGNVFVRGSGAEGGEIAFFNPDRTTTGMTVDISSANVGRIFQSENNSTLQLGQLIGTGGIVTFYTAATERMRIGPTGNISAGSSTTNISFDIGGGINLPAATTEGRNIELGTGRAGNGNSFIDLIGDATYTDYGLRIIRNSTGANANSDILHRGTGGLILNAQDASFISFLTASTTRFVVGSAGQWGIGGATYGTAGQAFVSGGAGAAPSWSSVGTFTTVAATTSVLSSGAGGIGYSTGAGVAVTQLTSRTTAAPTTGNKTSGAVTLFTTTAVVGTYFTFTVPNTAIAVTDTVSVSVRGATNTYVAFVSAIVAGTSFNVTMASVAGTASDTPILNFNIIRGVSA